MANTRHRLPAFPPLVLLAGYAVGEGVRVWRARRENWRPLAALIILMLAGIVLSRLPVIPRWMPVHEDWWTHINKGTALVQLDRDEEAAKEFRLATQVMPQKLEGWRQLALAREELGQYPEAVAAQEELLRLMNAQYPQYTAARAEQLEKLVTLIATAGDLPRAADLSRDLINLAPHNFRPYAMAAKISHAAGQTTVAINQLQRAEALAEGNPDAMKIVDSVRRQLK